MEELVKDIRLINVLIKLNIVTPCRETGSKIKTKDGRKNFTCFYVDSVKRTQHGGYEYYEKYFPGCFYPFVMRKPLYR